MSRQLETRAIVLSGTAVIAVCYGLGRYAYGLFVPEFHAALGLSGASLGVIGGLSHVGYALGLVAAPPLTRRVGPGKVSSAAGLAAATGMAGVAASGGALTLGLAVLVAGLGSGLASPALAQVVVRRLRPVEWSPAQTWINSGTSLGLALSAPAILLGTDWRTIWTIFAVVSVAVAVVARASLVEHRQAPVTGEGPHRAATRERMPSGSLLAYSVILGATSTAYWTFSRQQVLDTGMSDLWSSGFWVAIGVFGLVGGSAGVIANRLGLSRTLQVWGLVWTLALGTLALPSVPSPLALASAAGFGAAYMALTGLVILWSVAAYEDDAAAGVRACFLALGVGQAIGTPLAGVIADTWGLSTTFALSAALSLLLVPNASRAPRRGRQPATI